MPATTPKIFVNLPIKDLQKSVQFFTQLGFQFNPKFTTDDATCLIVSDSIYFMLLVERAFKSFTDKAICDSSKTTEALFALTVNTREEVDAMVGKAVAAGAKTPRKPQDHGFMYGHGFEDIDGHNWEVFWMDANT
jgi:predicted lactoylglutathione lyase